MADGILTSVVRAWDARGELDSDVLALRESGGGSSGGAEAGSSTGATVADAGGRRGGRARRRKKRIVVAPVRMKSTVLTIPSLMSRLRPSPPSVSFGTYFYSNLCFIDPCSS